METLHETFPFGTVRHSWAAMTAEGKPAFVLDTQQVGSIAFVVDEQSILQLKDTLAQLEAVLSA